MHYLNSQIFENTIRIQIHPRDLIFKEKRTRHSNESGKSTKFRWTSIKEAFKMDRLEIEDRKHAMSLFAITHYYLFKATVGIFSMSEIWPKNGKSQMSFVLFRGDGKKFTQMHIIKQPKIKHGIKGIRVFVREREREGGKRRTSSSIGICILCLNGWYEAAKCSYHLCDAIELHTRRKYFWKKKESTQ